MKKKFNTEDKILSGYVYRNKPVTNVGEYERVINIITGYKGAKELISAFKEKGASDNFIAENIEVFIDDQWVPISKTHIMLTTAKEFLEEKLGKGNFTEETGVKVRSVERLLDEFAKIHVKAALEAVLKDVLQRSSIDTLSYEDIKETVLNAYPLTNIK